MMRRRKFWVFLAFIFLCFIFVTAYFLIKNYYLKLRFFSGETLIGEVVIPSDSLGRINDLLCIGGYLILLDDRPLGNKGKIQIYDLNNFKLVTSVGRKGSGPGELVSPVSLNYVPGNPFKFSVFDVSLNRLTIYSLIQGRCEVDKIIKFEGAGIYYVHVIDSSKIGVIDFLSDGRVTLYDSSGKKIKTFGDLLPGRKKGTPLDVHKAAMQGKLKVNPNDGYCVVSATFSDFLDVYDRDGNLIKRFYGPLKILPSYKVESLMGYPVMALDTEKAMWGYVDLLVTDRYIYALYSGNPFKNGSDGKFIHVYNFDGKLLKTYQLSHGISSISFDSVKSRFFGADKSGNQVMMFETLNIFSNVND